PHGNKNQPDKPSLVISSNTALNQCGSLLAHSTALASSRGMETAAAATSARAITTIPGDCGSLADGAGRISARAQSATFSEMLCAMRCNGDRCDTPSPTGLAPTRPKPAFGAFTAGSQFQTPRARPACRC